MTVLTSSDGAKINCEVVGSGPAVVVVPGALTLLHDFDEFAAALAGRFEVWVMERRGRGESSPQGDSYSIEREIEDLQTALQTSGATRVFGHSYGGLVALETAKRERAIEQLAVYDPGVSVGGSIPMEWLHEYEARLRKGDEMGAFVTFIKGLGPTSARFNPDWSMRLILSKVFSQSERAEIFPMLPANLSEHREVARLDSTIESYRQVNARVRLLSGTKSKRADRQVIEMLERIIPKSSSQVLPKLDHFGPTKKGSGIVAAAVATFFAE